MPRTASILQSTKKTFACVWLAAFAMAGIAFVWWAFGQSFWFGVIAATTLTVGATVVLSSIEPWGDVGSFLLALECLVLLLFGAIWFVLELIDDSTFAIAILILLAVSSLLTFLLWLTTECLQLVVGGNESE